MNANYIRFLAAIVAVAGVTALGQTGPVHEAAVEQEALRQSTGAIRDDLRALKSEMQEYIPDDVAVVDQPARQMDALAQRELLQATKLMQAAEGETNDARRIQWLNAAQSNQVAAEQRLEEIWKQLGAPVAAADLLKTVRDTARQQAVAQSEARRLATRPDADEAVRNRRNALQREQERLAMVAGQIDSQLENTSQDAVNHRVEEEARAAAEALKAGDFAKADAEQAKTLESLQEIMNGLDPEGGAPDLDRLRDLRREMDVLANMQSSASRSLESGNTKETLAELERAASLAAALTPAASDLSPPTADRLKETGARTEALANALAAASRNGTPAPAQFAEAARAAAAATESARSELGQAIARGSPHAAAQGLGKSATAINSSAQGGPGRSKDAGNNPSAQRSSAKGPSQSAQGGGLGESSGDLANAGVAAKSGQAVSGLSPHDRDAAAQLQSITPPAEFAPEVGQYFKNLAEGVTPGSSD